MDLKALFQQHIDAVQISTEQVLNSLGFDALVLGAGSLSYFFQDDASLPFRSSHHFAHWCPVSGEEHLLLIRPGRKPKLLHYAPEDYWYEFAPVGHPYWLDAFEFQQFSTVDDLWRGLGSLPSRTAFHGPQNERSQTRGLVTEVAELTHHLNWMRSSKSAYEVAMLVEATRLAARGHRAAKECFDAGGSELDIHHAFVKACRTTDACLAYDTIVALNDKGAVLHYHNKRDDVRDGAVLLIDAGCRHMNYNSDITRTYANDLAPPEFHELLRRLETLQQTIAKSVKPGLSFEDLHHEAHMGIAAILLAVGVLRNLDAASAVKDGFSRAFFPHGLGHMLGIFVHDVAGRQKDPSGTPNDPSKVYPNLRTTRRIEQDHVITVEPGIYFIPMLLRPFRMGEQQKNFDWGLIDRLMPFGGIRIEDDVLVTATGSRNLTREHLP